MNFNIPPQVPKDDVKNTDSESKIEKNTTEPFISDSSEIETDKLKIDEENQESIRKEPFQVIMADLVMMGAAFLLIFLTVSLLSFSMSDPAWSRTSMESIEIHNIMGKIGAYSADVLYYLFGLSAWWNCFFLVFIIFNLIIVWHSRNTKSKSSFSFIYSLVGLAVLLFTSSTLEQIYLTDVIQKSLPLGAGGLVGNTLAPIFSSLLGTTFSSIVLFLLFIGGFILIIQTSWLYLFQSIGTSVLNIFTQKHEEPKSEKERTLLKAQSITQRPIEKPNFAVSSREVKLKQGNTLKNTKKNKIKDPIQPSIESIQDYERPILSLFKKPFKKISFNQKELKQKAIQQAETITSVFDKNNVASKLIKVDIGPVFFNYHIKLNLPNDAKEIQQSCSDLKEAFNSTNVFLTQPNPTRADYELLIAKEKPETISLMEIFSKDIFSNSNENLIIALGKDTHNQPILVSLENMPNFLISGDNHSEILLGMKATMASLIARYTSKHLKMILMGKNEKDFDSYVNLPHLIAPFVNNPDSALNTFNWCLDESKKRLQILHDTKCNDINELNQKIYSAFGKNIFIADPFSEDLDNPAPLKPLPFLVVFIDELDWLQSTLQQIDKQLFLDLVQYSKEIGIHLVLTQSSPSVHSLTPTLKYIFPTRLAFKVDSHVESLLILNQLGAEKLIVKGDALLLLPDHRQTIRLQIGTLNQKEYSQLVSNFQSKQTFDDNIINYQPKQTNTTPENQDLYDMAVQHVLNSQKTSISFLQRKMKIGYNLANQLLEQMEMNGILSKAELGGKREILIHSNKQQAKGKKWH